MKIIHAMKDGSVVQDITGRVVRFEDAQSLYRLMESLNHKSYKRKSNTYKIDCMR